MTMNQAFLTGDLPLHRFTTVLALNWLKQAWFGGFYTAKLLFFVLPYHLTTSYPYLSYKREPRAKYYWIRSDQRDHGLPFAIILAIAS